jgi:hypothetical protein
VRILFFGTVEEIEKLIDLSVIVCFVFAAKKLKLNITPEMFEGQAVLIEAIRKA